jgi:hypothetical protein
MGGALAIGLYLAYPFSFGGFEIKPLIGADYITESGAETRANNKPGDTNWAIKGGVRLSFQWFYLEGSFDYLLGDYYYPADPLVSGGLTRNSENESYYRNLDFLGGAQYQITIKMGILLQAKQTNYYLDGELVRSFTGVRPREVE